MGAASKDCGAVATPARRRSKNGDRQDKKSEAAGASPAPQAEKEVAAKFSKDLPADAKGLTWPSKFCESPKGDRVEFSEDGALATRTSGVGHGAVFIGPLSLEKNGSAAYFEVEVAEMEPNRSQTLAIGICTTLPAAKSLRVERARDLGEGTHIIGYDLPKVFANGAEVSKISTKEWRPLKELKVGDRVGLLIHRRSSELTVFVNGVKKATASGLGGGQRWPGDVYGVVDLHGTVKAVWLHSTVAIRRRLQRSATVAMPAPLPQPTPASCADVSAEQADSSSQATQAQAAQETPAPAAQAAPALAALPPPAPAAPDSNENAIVEKPRVGAGRCQRSASKALLDATPRYNKRTKMACFPCGCMVHLHRSSSAQVIHVSLTEPFVIGRHESSNLVLDSAEVPKMVSRKHATLSSAHGSVVLQDANSTNGTFVNGRRVRHETLRHGDAVVVGIPAQSPKELQFRVTFPAEA